MEFSGARMTMKGLLSPIFRLFKHRPLPFIPLRTINARIEAEGTSSSLRQRAVPANETSARDIGIAVPQMPAHQIGIASDD